LINCQECWKHISSYLDGEIDRDLKRDLEQHLIFCHHCQVVVDSTRKTIDLYCDGKLFQLPGSVRDRLHAALRRRWDQKPGQVP
jgi:anti-sigma factor RsiW